MFRDITLIIGLTMAATGFVLALDVPFLHSPKNRTRNERKERIKDAFMMVGISAFLVLIFLAGMNAMLAFEAAAW